MNIRLGSRERASVLVMCIFCTLIIVSGLIVCRYLQKWAKRIDTGEQVPVPGFNSNDVVVPNPQNPNITGGRFEDYHRNYMWYLPSFAALPEPPIKTNVIVYVSYLGTNLVLQVQIQTNKPATAAQLGIPVDQYGIPTDFSWSMGFVPSGGRKCLIERSTNCLDWEPVSTVTIPDGYTNALTLEEQSNTMFYRGLEQQ